MATQNFTTYTETDPGSKLTVTASRVTFADLKGTDGWTDVSKDMGAAHFPGDFEHLFTVKVDENPITSGFHMARLHNGTHAISILFQGSGANLIFNLLESYTSSYNDPSSAASLGTIYYPKFKRVEAVGTYGTIYAYIYIDAERTSLFDTLSVALHAKLDYQYSVPFLKGNSADTNDTSGYVENLDLQENITPTTAALTLTTFVSTITVTITPTTLDLILTLFTAAIEKYYIRWGRQPIRRSTYKIEIRDNNGLNARRIVDIEQGTLDQSVNNPAAVSLTCPMSPAIEAALSSIQRPNQLWITKNDTLFYTGNFSLIDIAHSSLESVRVDSLDWMNQLKDEFVEYYDAEDTVDNHVDAFLAEQVDVRPVLLGTIEPTLTRDLTIERDTIYNALMSMRDSVGGYMTVDAYHKLNWYWTLSESTGQQIRYKKNLVGITKSIDWMNFGNRLYIYGDGCDLTDAGYATTYIEDATSIATYGLVIRKIYKQSYAYADTMLNFAKLKIQEMAFPRITYTVDIANLEDFGFTEDELTLGSWLTLIDDEIGVNVDVQIVRIIWDLVRCEKVQIELSVKSSDICDIVPGVYIL